MRELVKLIAVLTAICIVAGILLAWVHGLTAEPISRAQLQKTLAALEQVLPPSDPVDTNAVVTVATGAGDSVAFQLAFDDGAFAGAAAAIATAEGYGGDIRLMVGLRPDGTVQGVRVLRHAETPGLGAKITGPDFLAQFSGKTAEADWRVRKDGGGFEQITAATISSRAAVAAVGRIVAVFEQNAEHIRERARQLAARPAAGGEAQ